MAEKEVSEETEKIVKTIDKKIQYGENEYSCFACGEKINFGAKICPYCNTEQDKNGTVLK
ncbi:MAG: hypothetical protein ACXABG_09155 [Promethearchaeota archaeon]|jgi:hypothetical protein